MERTRRRLCGLLGVLLGLLSLAGARGTFPDFPSGLPHGGATAIARAQGSTRYADLARGANLATRKAGRTTYLSAKRNARLSAMAAQLQQGVQLSLAQDMKAAVADARKAGFFSRLSSGMYNLLPGRVRHTLDRYFIGLKKLFQDLSETFKLWKRMRKTRHWWRGSLILDNGPAVLTWREKTLLRRVPMDFLRMFPIICNPIPPPFGLAVPLLACVFPRALLTHQFHTQHEAALYAWEDHSRKIEAKRGALTSLLQDAAGGGMDERYEHAFLPTPSGEFWIDGEAKEAEESAVHLLAGFFDDKSGSAGLDSLSRRHLLHLVDAWVGGSPGVSTKLRTTLRYPLRMFMPTSALRDGLRKIANEIARDDALLAGKGQVESLTTDELEYACKCRGITPSMHHLGHRRHEVLQSRLSSYLRVRERVDGSGAGREGKSPEIHRSLILHLPALMPEGANTKT